MTDIKGHLFDTSTPAVVLKLTPNVMHHGVLGVTRSLGRAGVAVYGVHEGSWAPAASSRYLAGRFFWQANANDADRLTEGLLRLATHIGRPAVLFATDDAGALFLSEHGNDLRRSFLFPDNPADLPRKLAGKHSLYKLCREQGIPAPQACVPESLDAARVFARSVGYPLIIKLISPWIADWRLPSTSVVLSEHDLSQRYDHCKQFNAELMLQEFIPGGQGHDWFFHGYCDAKSVCRPTFTGIKERSFPVSAGRTTFGRSADNKQLRGEIIDLLTRIGYRGIMDVDVRLDARDGQYNVVDFNPRLGAQFRIFEDTAGVDVALAAYLDLTGQAIPTGEQLNDRTFMVESYDPLSALANWRQGKLSLGYWLSSLRTLDEVAWFAWDDLRPFGLMCVRMSWKFISRPFVSTNAAIDSTAASPPTCRYRPGRASSGKMPGLVRRSTVLDAQIAEGEQ